MWRWLFFLLLAANLLPVLLAGNRGVIADSPRKPEAAENAGNGDPIVLLGERGEAGPPAPEGEESGNPALPQRRERRCFLLGPLASMASAESYAETLETSGVEIDRHWREVVVGSDYWVYLPRLPSARATARTLQELEASDIKGFIFSEGELEGAIALEVFTDEAAARASKAMFSELGYDAGIYKIDRFARQYWLMSETVPRPAVMVDLMKSHNVTEIPQKISRMDCKTVASAMHFQ